MGVRLGRSLRALRQAFGRYRLLRYRPKAFPCAPLPASPASLLRFATGDAGDAFAPETQPHPLPAARWAGARWRFSALPALRYRVGHRGSATDPPDARLLALQQFPRVLFRCLASSASSGLSPLGRCRRFGSLAPALPAFVGLGSPTARRRPIGRLSLYAPDPRPRSRPCDPPVVRQRAGCTRATPAAATPCGYPLRPKGHWCSALRGSGLKKKKWNQPRQRRV